MINCEKCGTLFEKALNNEINSRELENLNKHISVCNECASEYADLTNTLKTMKRYNTPEPRDEFIENIWESIEPEIVKSPAKSESNLKHIYESIFSAGSEFAWTKQLAGAFAILIIGIVLGRYFFGNGQLPADSGVYNNKFAKQTAVQIKAENYIERSKVLLLGLMNFDPAVDDVNSINLEQQKSISRLLLNDANSLKSELTRSSQSNLKELVGDLEVILLQIANLESEQDIQGIELVKEGVDKRGIFLKINIRELTGSNINSSRIDHKSDKEKKGI